MQTPAGTTATAYDSRGNVVSVTDPAGGVTLFAHDADNRVTSVTDPTGGTWLTTYDPAGRVIASTSPLGAVTRQEWTPSGHLAAVIDPLGRKTAYAYDTAGHQTAVTSPEGGTTQYAYDQDGRLISVTTPAGLLTRYTYDSAGRLIAITDPRGWITRYELDQRGDKTAVISPSGAITCYRYDAAGQLTQTTDPNGSATEYVYDNAGNVVSVTDAKGATSRYSYDADKRLTSSTDPLGRTTLREYDQAGNLVAVTDPSGQAQHMAYDPDGRLTEWTGTDGTAVTYTYDLAGRRTSMTDVTGTTRYTYDSAGQLVTVVEPDGATATSGYDAAGQRTSLTYPDGLEVTYSFDGNGRLTSLHDSRAGQAAYALDPDGRLLTEQLPGRLARRYQYDHGLLCQFLAIRDGRPIAQTSLSHDPDGRILAARDDDWAREYRYDAAGQLVYAASRPVAPHAGQGTDRAELVFTYDAAGNRASVRRGGTETHFRYDAADQLLAAATGGKHTDFAYDSSGRLTEETEDGSRKVVDYDGFGRPSAITRTEHGLTEQIHATFNGDGLLTALTSTAASERTEEEQAASVRYRWSFGEQIPQILSQRSDHALDDTLHGRDESLSADFTYGYSRVFASTEHAAATFHRDAFGSAIRTDQTQAWTQAHAYEIFGEPHDPSSGERRHAELRPPELPRFGYRGELALGSMLYLRARAYDTSLGRFTTHDAVSAPSAQQPPTNPYAYADNDPLDLADPLGAQAGDPLTAPAGLGVLAGLDVGLTAKAAAIISMIPAGNEGGQPLLQGLSGVVAHYYPPVTETIDWSIFRYVPLPRAGYQIAHFDVYLNDAQTMQFASDLGNASGWYGAAGLIGGEIAEILGIISAELFLTSLYIQQLNQEGGNEGIYFDFYAYRTFVEVPISFSWPWSFRYSRLSWSQWTYGGGITIRVPGVSLSLTIPVLPPPYVWYQGSSPGPAARILQAITEEILSALP
jgi:RHS repeat-associated protein